MSTLNRKKKRWLWALAWALASALIFLCVRDMQWDLLLAELKKINPLWLVAGVAFNLAILIFWAWQWIAFLPKSFKVTFPRMIEINALMSMMSNTVPFLAGQALGVILLARRERVGHTVALSVMAQDQLAEGLAKLSIFLAAALLTPLPEWMQNGMLAAIAGIFLFFAVTFISAHRHRNLKIFLDKHSHPRLHKFWNHLSRWAHHLEALKDIRIFTSGMIMAWAMKGSELLAIFAIQKSFGIDLPLWTLFLVLASVNLATMIPVAPGNLGVYEAAVFFIYQYLEVPSEQALGMALFQHLCFLIASIGSGYLVLLLRNFHPLAPQATPTGDFPAK